MSNESLGKSAIYFFEDYSAKDLKEEVVGRKGYSLFKLKDMDVPVPEFFVLSSEVFSEFALKVFEENNSKLLAKGRNPESREVEDLFVREEFSKEVQEEILSAYTRLSGFTDAWVSIRSSVVFPQRKDVSFSGIFSTELNVRKYSDLEQAMKRVFASMFNDDVVAYSMRMGIDLSDVKMSVVVQKMVQSEVSGVTFTVDPITQDRTKLSIEAVYGLGDVISLGEITPDTYLLNKKDLSVIEKHIAPQEWMKVRTMKNTGRGSKGIEKIKISRNWSHKQKLSDKDIEEISKISLVIEEKSGEPEDVEWVLSGGRFWILQNKSLLRDMLNERIEVASVSISRKNIREVILGFVEKYRIKDEMISSAMTEAQKVVEKNSDETIRKLEELIVLAKKELDSQLTKGDTKKEDFVISGIGASFGKVVGKIRIVSGPTGKKFTKQDILLIKSYSSEMESMILSCGGIIMETGGLTSDTAILCREFGIPAIVGVVSASTLLKEGDVVKLDGNSGTIYRENQSAIAQDGVHPVVSAYTAGEISGVDLLKSEKQTEEKEKVPVKDITLPPSATKVFSMVDRSSEKIFDFVGDAHGLAYLDLDRIMIEDGKHILAYVNEKKYVDYTKKITEKILEYVNLMKGEEVILSIGSAKVKEFRSLVGGKKYENESLSPEIYGANHYINNPELLKRVIRIIRGIRNIYKKRNVSLAIHSPMNEDVLIEMKKQLSGEKIRRTSSFKMYVILDNPSEIILADEIANTKIDGIILNMPRIVRQMQGFKLEEKDAKYDLARHSVFKVLDNVLESVKSKVERTIVIVENSKPLLKYAVQVGVYGISVLPEDIKEARKVTAEEEAKIILGK